MSLRTARLEHGLSQEKLADRVGISSQAFRSIESGKAVPATDVALRLARALGVPVEELFWLADQTNDLPVFAPEPLDPGDRVQLVSVGGRLIARGLRGDRGVSHVLPRADGVATGPASVHLFEPGGDVSHRLVLTGCDPAVTVLADWLGRARGRVDLLWDECGSRSALEALGRREAHLAGCHLGDEASGTYHRRFVEQFVPFPCTLVSFCIWEQGIVVAPGNPRRIKGIADLVRPDVTIVNREPGAGSRRLLDAQLTRMGIEPSMVAGYRRELLGHLAIAESVAHGSADAGIAIKAAARALGLDFVALAQERYDLVIPDAHLDHPGVQSMLDVLGNRSFRREVEALGGYDIGDMGKTA